MTSTVIDMLIRIKNAQMAKLEHVSVPASKAKIKISEILAQSGYLSNFEKKTKKTGKSEHDYLMLQLKYNNGEEAVSGIKIISKPSRKMYIKAKDIKPVRSGYGISVISTPKGIMSSVEARKQKVGGELLFEIW